MRKKKKTLDYTNMLIPLITTLYLLPAKNGRFFLACSSQLIHWLALCAIAKLCTKATRTMYKLNSWNELHVTI